MYWRFLGQARPGALSLFVTRALAGLSWRTRGYIAARPWFPFLTLSHRLISEAGSLSGLIQWSPADFKKLKGIGHIKALQLITVMEIARRTIEQSRDPDPNPLIESADDAVEKFYKGRTINSVVPFGPGGGYAIYSQIMARHLGQFIPGNPQIVLQYRPGAGGIVASNYIYNVAPRDGS